MTPDEIHDTQGEIIDSIFLTCTDCDMPHYGFAAGSRCTDDRCRGVLMLPGLVVDLERTAAQARIDIKAVCAGVNEIDRYIERLQEMANAKCRQ